ncbi:MAG: glycosyltransferase family 39 protein [Bradyrhizobiaceae bacterium]|nr:glycosyltransferase family 39 protein [Bradyrhizobiaceae bacterium]
MSKGSPSAGVDQFLTAAAASHLRALAVLAVLALASFLPGFFQIPPVDRDEARFAQATKQMIETGDYVDIRFQEEARYKKPVGIYWLQAAVVQAAEAVGVPEARTTIALYRIPSLLGAVGAVLATYWAAMAFVSRRAALMAGVMMATSILLGVEARLAKTDAMLLLTCVTALGAMARAYLAEQGDRPSSLPPFAIAAIFWAAIAAGILIKGPMILMFVGLCAVALAATDRSVGWMLRLKPLVGVPLALAIVTPWLAAIIVRSGGTFLTDSLGGDMLAKVTGGQETHGLPPGFYLAAFWLTFLPGALLAGLAAPAVWRARAEPGCKLLLAWIVPAWIVFELVPTKLPHYVLPLYPALAILIAGAVDSRSLSRNLWLVRGTVWWFILMMMVALLLIALQLVVGHQLGLWTWTFAAAAVIFSLFAWLLYESDGPEASLARAAAASLMLSIAAYAATFPGLRQLFPSVGLANYMHSAGCADPEAVTAGFHEPSLVFLAGTGVTHGQGSTAADFLIGGPCRFAFVESRQERAFVQRAEAIGLRYTPGPHVEGFNINGAGAVNIATFRSELNP